MKLLGLAILRGGCVTVILVVLAMAIDSEKASCFLLWQKCLLDRLIGPYPSFHLNPVALLWGIISAWITYTLLAYALLRWQRRGDTN
jgi:hypothetical protein